MADYLRPTEPFTCVDAEGTKRRFDPTMLVAADHWAVKGRERLFAAARDVDEAEQERITSFGPRLDDQGIERATAAPGERRTTRRPKKTEEGSDGA